MQKTRKKYFFRESRISATFYRRKSGKKLIEPPFEGEYAEIFISKEFYQIPIIKVKNPKNWKNVVN